jgi:predicted fused transcriptional regulator/phosphomethylpyrimidine kinase/predicted transcriptional regulator
VKFVEEVVVDEFLPTFRSLLAEDLRERGLTQREVADALGISQSAVSKYVHGEIRRQDAFVEDDRVQDLVARVGAGLADGSTSRVQALVETEVLIRELEARGDLLAVRHEAAMPALADYDGDFRVHDPDSRVRARERVLSSVRRGVRTIENTSGFATLIPNVGSNLVECLHDAETVDDVAGVPGRIIDVKGRAILPGDPEFGVSEHVASVLLGARAAGSNARAALDIRYDPAILDRLRTAGHHAVEFDPEYDDVRDAVRRALADRPDATVVYQTGGFGIEPVAYLLGESAEDVAATARDLLRDD